MSGNTGGAKAGAKINAYPISEVFEAFDALPPEVRAALNEANFKYDPVWVMGQWKDNRRDRTVAEFVADMTAHFRLFEAGL